MQLLPDKTLQRIREWTFLLDRHAGPRLRRLERRGLLWAIASISLLSTGTLLLAGEWQREVDLARQVDIYLRAVVRARHTARRDETSFGKLALVLGSSNVAAEDTLMLTEIPRRWRDVLVPMRDGVAAAAFTGERSLKNCGGSAGLQATMETRSSWQQTRRPYRLGALDAMDPLASIDGFAMGPASCSAGAHNVLTYVPAPVRYYRDRGYDRTLKFSCGTKVQDGSTFLCAHASAEQVFTRLSKLLTEDPHLAQAFFISPDGSMTIWSRDGAGPRNMWKDPLGGYTFGSYFRFFAKRPSFVNRDRVHITPAYVDYFGVGVVRTACTGVHGPQESSTSGGEASPFLGVVCIDVNAPVFLGEEQVSGPVPLGALTQKVSLDNPLFETLLYCEDDGEIFDYEAGPGTCALSRRIARGDLRDEESRLLSRAAGKTFDRAEGGNENVKEDPARMGAASLMLARPTGSEQRIIALFRPRPLEPDVPRLLYGCTCLLAAFIAAAVAGLRGQEERNRLTTVELLRSLPVGVVMIDRHAQIIFGNDRAEELLNAPLPTYWSSSPELAPQNFSRFLLRGNRETDHHDIEVVPLLRSGAAAPGRKRYHLGEFFAQVAPSLRARGRPYVYCARLKRPNGEAITIVVRGTPVIRLEARWRRFLGGRGPDTWYALGVFDESIGADNLETTVRR